ncbi:hypothetical protein N7G274_000157 [Stereocaulon virgatum]|uniref:Uncharacterized protein n=1 Tax=Stereocaulon virgatum TaxID=373712 RepID=A0ABR4ATW3_9LECA
MAQNLPHIITMCTVLSSDMNLHEVIGYRRSVLEMIVKATETASQPANPCRSLESNFIDLHVSPMQQREGTGALMAENRQIVLIEIIAIGTSSALFTPLTTSIGRFGLFPSICAACTMVKETEEETQSKKIENHSALQSIACNVDIPKAKSYGQDDYPTLKYRILLISRSDEQETRRSFFIKVRASLLSDWTVLLILLT